MILEKKYWAYPLLLLFSLTIFAVFSSCGKKEGNDPSASSKQSSSEKKTATQKQAERRSVSFNDQLSKIRNAPSESERIRNIYNASNVDKKEQDEMIKYLADIMTNASNVQERVAAASSLINLGTKKALLPVKEVFLFGMDNRLNLGIIQKIKKKNGHNYKHIFSKWCTEILNDKNTLSSFREKQILNALNLFETFFKGKDFIDAKLYIQDSSKKVSMAMYELLQKYPKQKIPVDFLNSRLREKFSGNKLLMDPKEAKYIADLMIKYDLDISTKLEQVVIEHGLTHEKPEVRAETVYGILFSWENWNYTDRKVLKSTLEDLQKNDPYKVEGYAPVREAAGIVLEQID